MLVTGVARYFDWEGVKMENLVTLVWWRFSVTSLKWRHHWF